MDPKSNQPAKIYATAKTHKFNGIDEVNTNDLKFKIIDQTDMYTYHAAKVISSYIKPLRSSEYLIKDTQVFIVCIGISTPPPLNVAFFSECPKYQSFIHNLSFSFKSN